VAGGQAAACPATANTPLRVLVAGVAVSLSKDLSKGLGHFSIVKWVLFRLTKQVWQQLLLDGYGV